MITSWGTGILNLALISLVFWVTGPRLGFSGSTCFAIPRVGTVSTKEVVRELQTWTNILKIEPSPENVKRIAEHFELQFEQLPVNHRRSVIKQYLAFFLTKPTTPADPIYISTRRRIASAILNTIYRPNKLDFEENLDFTIDNLSLFSENHISMAMPSQVRLNVVEQLIRRWDRLPQVRDYSFESFGQVIAEMDAPTLTKIQKNIASRLFSPNTIEHISGATHKEAFRVLRGLHLSGATLEWDQLTLPEINFKPANAVDLQMWFRIVKLTDPVLWAALIRKGARDPGESSKSLPYAPLRDLVVAALQARGFGNFDPATRDPASGQVIDLKRGNQFVLIDPSTRFVFQTETDGMALSNWEKMVTKVLERRGHVLRVPFADLTPEKINTTLGRIIQHLDAT